tara:strand:- start:1765 stop:2883 length:1119 start_codon:yes stop_codon:yes gene_type:complete
MESYSFGKKLIFTLATFCIFLFLFLVILEISLRFFTVPSETPGFTRTHPTRRYELRPGFSGKTYDATLKINSNGFRDLERPISQGNDSYRIAILGDSITFGVGVEMEETFPKILENKLNKVLKFPVQVFNLGVNSYNTVTEYYYLKEIYDVLKPQMVIIEFSIGNDTGLTKPPGGLKNINKIKFVRIIKDIARHLYSYHWLAAKYYNFQYAYMGWFFGFGAHSKEKELSNDPHQKLLLDYLNLYNDSFQGWIDAQQAFTDIDRFCKEKNITLLFAISTSNISLSSKLETDALYPIVKKVFNSLENKNINNILLLNESFRYYSGKKIQYLWVRPDDSHYSVLAHKLAGKGLFDYIIDRKLITDNFSPKNNKTP